MNQIQTDLARIEAKIDVLTQALNQGREQLLQLEEAANFCGCSIDKFRRIHSQFAPSYRVGRRLMFKRSELIEGMSKRKQNLSEFEIQDKYSISHHSNFQNFA